VVDAEQEHPEPADQLDDRAHVHGVDDLCRSLPFPAGLAAKTLQSPTYGPLGACKSAAKRGVRGGVLLLVNNTRKIPEDYFYTAHVIDAAPRAIYIF
jgi:hypothetical protein